MYEFLYEDGPVPEVTAIVAASLVNIPALRMPSLNSKQPTPRGVRKMNEEQARELAAKLGLPEDAKFETILAAVESRQSEEVAEVQVATPDLNEWIPRAEFDALAARTAELEQATQVTRVDQALSKHKSKIQSPAYEKVLREQLTSGALTYAAFEALMEAAPESRLQKADERSPKQEFDVAALELSELERQFIQKRAGGDPDKFAAEAKRFAEIRAKHRRGA